MTYYRFSSGMRAGCLRFIAALVVCTAAPVRPASAADAEARARELIAATRAGAEADVACERLDADVARALIAWGTTARSESFDTIVHAFRLAERAGRCLGSDDILGSALIELSAATKDHGNFQEALSQAQEAVRVVERTNDLGLLARAWNDVGMAQGWLNNGTGELDAYNRALDMARAAGDRSVEARVLNNLSQHHKSAGNLTAGIEELTRALALFEELGDSARAAVVVNNIALNYFNRGDYSTALQYNDQALEINRRVGSDFRLGGSLDTRANIYRSMGAFRQALDTYGQALATRKRIGDNPGVMETTNNIGLVHLSQGDYELAIDAFKQALRLNEQLHDNGLSAEALRNIGAAAFRLGQRPRARANLEQALTIARSDGLRPIEAELLNDLGEIARTDGRLAEADRLLASALALRRQIPDEAGVTETLIALANVRLRQGRSDEARDLVQHAATNAERHDQAEYLWSARTVLGRAYRQLARVDAARNAFRSAIDAVEALSRETAGADTLRQQFFEDKISPYHELIDLDIQERRFEEAIEVGEASKARVLSQLIGRHAVRDDAVLLADERRERVRLADQLFAANQRIERQRENDASDVTRLAALERDRHDTRNAVAAFETLLAARHPEVATARGDVSPVKTGDLAPLLSGGRVVLEFVVADQHVSAFAIHSRANRPIFTARTISIPAETLSRRTTQFRDRIAARDFAFGDEAHALYDLLVKPFEQELEGASQLVVIPDGPLWNVPFQALMNDHGYLIEQLPVSYAPSLTVLRAIQHLPRPAGPRTLLGVGRSQFGKASGLEALPDTDTQLKQLRDVYGPQRATLFIDSDATERQFKTAAPRYSVLHLATHGILDESSPLYSYLALAADRAAGDDGRLEAWEIMGLKLSADLVVLAACDMGRGRIAPGEGVIGTMWALFAAGARSMVVSQYKAEAKSAADLLVGFHRRLVAGTGGKSASLRAAALDLLKNPRYAHPYYWADFILVGDPD